MKALGALALFLTLAVPAWAGTPADTTVTPGKSHTLLWGAVTVVAIGGAAALDRTVYLESNKSHSSFEDDLANFAQPFGGVGTAAGLVVTYGAAKIFGHSTLARSTVRIGVSDIVAGLGALAIKYPVGRKRPNDSPADPFQFDPFSGNVSFPSGHTTIAFATAVAIDRETRAGWVPWVAYPMAGLVGWSRIHENEHWLSDVVGGAALGAFTATTVENHFQKHGMGWFQRFCWTVEPEPHGLAVVATLVGG
jgi:membrane-associated phospholipid phosphatase